MKEFDKILDKEVTERTVIVGLVTQRQNEAKAAEYLDELEFLADTAGAKVVHRFTQKLDGPHSRTFVGQGKLAEIKEYVEKNDIGMVIFDDDLSTKQLANIEKELQVKILDRSSLILDIFAKRAQTATAKTQVELAQYRYLLPRLTRMWTHLERQRGGIGMRGPGETQIETDRRIILRRISLLKEQLRDIDRQKTLQRKNRGNLTRVALVGYTNVGKSTLMNLLSKSDVFAENKLFATLDTTVRKVIIDNLPFLLTDTVGFIRKLPTHLVESFKSTLDEVRDADLLVHVVDISHPQFEEQIEVVNRTLAEVCDSADKPMILVFNKIDAYTYQPKDEDDLTPRTRENVPLEELKATWMNRLSPGNCVFVSARKGTNIDELKAILYRKAREIHVERFPYNDFLFQKYDDDDDQSLSSPSDTGSADLSAAQLDDITRGIADAGRELTSGE
ncbi:MAG: GTPase HflX [Muribaculaceae bacterium]|nr:GTPase HflX [Muribaculaceae bacterium]